jgi:hypothetical protein
MKLPKQKLYKTPVATICTAIVVSLLNTATAQTSNGLAVVDLSKRTNYFLSVDDLEVGNKVAFIDPSKLDTALRSPDSRPEAEDPLGNWGKPCEGLRMGLRLPKAAYRKGEPIVADILIRNVVEREVDYARLGTDADFQFVITDSAGEKHPNIKPDEPGRYGPKVIRLFPSTQKKIKIRVDHHFDLKPAEYSVTVGTAVDKLTGHGYSDMSSAPAHFKIVVDSPPPPESLPAIPR